MLATLYRLLIDVDCVSTGQSPYRLDCNCNGGGLMFVRKEILSNLLAIEKNNRKFI